MLFNTAKVKIMHLDVNSCFATIEQQANPFLRGKPLVVAAYTTPNGCILASSIEAKRLGIKTGMRVVDGRKIYPNLIVLPPDPHKYRNVHTRIKKILFDYSPTVFPRSIDEFVFEPVSKDLLTVAGNIKKRIRKEVGEYISVSIGISTNRYLAKIAAGIVKPDGLVQINKDNFTDIYSGLKLTDLTGIKEANAKRLTSVGIYSVEDFYNAPIWKLKIAFHSISGYYWFLRLRGFEIDDQEFVRRSFGNSVAIGKKIDTTKDASPILSRLCEKMTARLRNAGYKASGIHLAILYKNNNFWHRGRSVKREIVDARDAYMESFRILCEAGVKNPIRNIAVSCFGLKKIEASQLELFCDVEKKRKLVAASDRINTRWGDFTLGAARSFVGENVVLDRIAFGGVRDLPGFQP